MNNQPTYSFRRLAHSIMVYKYLILFFQIIFISSNTYSNIIYDKNGISVSEIELEQYNEVYEQNYSNKLSNNSALKNIVIIKQTIKKLQEDNQEFIKILDNNLKLEFGEDLFANNIKTDFYRFFKIRNEFISEYFAYKFSIQDLKQALSQESMNITIPISKNDCLTIDKVIKITDSDDIFEEIYRLLKENNKKMMLKFNQEIYQACISQKNLKIIEALVIDFIKVNTKDDFNKFVYGINN